MDYNKFIQDQRDNTCKQCNGTGIIKEIDKNSKENFKYCSCTAYKRKVNNG